MKKLKKPTVGILMATLVFSNMQLAPIYGNESNDIEENTNNQIVQNEEINIEYQNKSSKEDEIINIPDINFKKAINLELGKDENSDITRAELESLQDLSCEDMNIENIEGIQYCINLEVLGLDNNNISDISKLSELTNLWILGLDNNNISDISKLSELTNMWSLGLNNNNISDISALSKLTNMWSLGLSNNNISDISALSGLIDLTGLNSDLAGLDLSNNNISDISVLSGFISLEGLNLSNNNVSDISPLSQLEFLSELNLSNNKISDITPLLNLKNLGTLSLSENLLDLNDSKTIEVIQYLEGICNEVYYDKPIEFNDIKGHWAEETIKSFTDKGFINGYEDNTFRPNNNMTRAEFVKVVNKVFGYTQKDEEHFTDVNEGDWYYEDICIGIKEGYINGKSKDIFAPNDSITRQEVAMILTNIMKNKDENLDKLNTFKDGDKAAKWAQSSVEGAIEAGYLNGYEDKTIRANGNITRAEAISMLSRVKK